MEADPAAVRNRGKPTPYPASSSRRSRDSSVSSRPPRSRQRRCARSDHRVAGGEAASGARARRTGRWHADHRAVSRSRRASEPGSRMWWSTRKRGAGRRSAAHPGGARPGCRSRGAHRRSHVATGPRSRKSSVREARLRAAADQRVSLRPPLHDVSSDAVRWTTRSPTEQHGPARLTAPPAGYGLRSARSDRRSAGR